MRQRLDLDTIHYCRVIIFFCLVTAAVAAPAFAANKVALVIGNSQYGTSPLKNPANDATDMAALLTSAGFDVILRIDADKRAMLESIEAFGRKLPRAEIGMLYFAGHGMQIKGRNYLIPVNARVASETDVELESVDVYRVLGRMEAAANPVNIIILDACRDNPFERSFRNAEKGLAKIDAPAGSIIVFATSPGGVAADGRGRNGIFTSHLLKTLAKPDISLTRALMETRRNVAVETSRQQIPWESSSLMQDVFLLAGGAPEDRDLMPVQTSPRTETEQDPAPATSPPSAAKPSSKTCGAYTAPGVWKEFDCYNLAAIGKTTNDDPFTPSWRLIGGYWQWGRKGPSSSQWHNTNTKHFAHGPTGSGSSDASSGEISGWDYSHASNGAWSDSRKTANDPCPPGYRVPTKKQWDGVLKNNTQRTVGTWSDSATNYSSARFFGDNLLLPAAGGRYYASGALYARGHRGYYWGSSHSAGSKAWGLCFYSGDVDAGYSLFRRGGFSVRCVTDVAPTPEPAVSAVIAPTKTIPAQTSHWPAVASKAYSPRAGDIWKEPVTGMEFVWVPGGCYMMGSPLTGKTALTDPKERPFWYKTLAAVSSLLPYGCVSSSTSSRSQISKSPQRTRSYFEIHGYEEDETPVHEVCLDGFWMGRHEVTQGQWQKIMGSNPSHFKTGDNYPVEQISWNDAKAFFEKLNQQSRMQFALPTEAQWEYAARSSGREEKYAGGNDVDRVAWYGNNSGGKTHRVGTKAPNGLGIYDMSGNVWEWCGDVFDKEAYSKHDRNNPVVTLGGTARVCRGGSWSSKLGNVRTANRIGSFPDLRDRFLGFRLSLPQVRQQ